MKIEIQVVSSIKTDNVLPASFPCGDGKRKVLSDQFTVLTVPVKEKNQDGTDKIYDEFRIGFTNRKDSYSISYNVDEKGEPSTQKDAALKRVIDEFLLMHPLTTLNGKRHAYTKEPMYDVVDANVKSKQELTDWDKNRDVINYIADSEIAELRNICYYFGKDPKDKDLGALKLFIAHFEFGFVFLERLAEKFIFAFIKESDPLRSMKVNIRKAIEYGIIATQNKNGQNVYYINGDFAGSDVDEIIGFCKRNEEMYNDFVVRKVGEKDPHNIHTHQPLSVKDAASSDPASLGILRSKVLNLIDELNAAGVKHDVLKISMQQAGLAKLQDTYDKLILLIEKVK